MRKSEGLVSVTSETMTVAEVDGLVKDNDVRKFARILKEELIRHNELIRQKSLSDVSWVSPMDPNHSVAKRRDSGKHVV